MTVRLHVGGGVDGVAAPEADLVDWETVSRAVGDTQGEGRAVVVARARQLARALAEQRGETVLILDGADVDAFDPPVPVEPTPWVTGVPLAGFTALLVVVTLLALTAGVAQLNALLAVVVTLVVVGGLAPSAWRARERPVWRWVSLGFAVGVVLVGVRLLLLTLA